MKTISPSALPPNPYTLQPIRNREKLAGRSDELSRIRYYLELLSAGNVNHLALIGDRGAGKTSLLNAAESIAADLAILPVRINLDEATSKSPGVFWHHVYASLLLGLGDVNCFGGFTGPIYTALFEMVHARKLASLDNAVLQFPVVLATHPGHLEDIQCPDALISRDLSTISKELVRLKYKGLAILIDEADCLGSNKPLIQMFRNIFQQADRCCLILAGTEAVFPALSEVFSPIPRQFHRIKVSPFSSWVQTSELIRIPLSVDNSAADEIEPEFETVEDLHELCGGDPQELQLYCHHMYRWVEMDWARERQSRMTLRPEVFRDVLREYRANAASVDEQLLNTIEALPDKLLFKCPWLRRRRLSREESVQLMVFIGEMDDGELIAEEQVEVLRREVYESYRELFRLGLSSSDQRLALKGAPLTAGFWKSHVAVEKSQRWSWDEDSFELALDQVMRYEIGEATNADVAVFQRAEFECGRVLHALRENKPVTDLPASVVYALVTVVRTHRSRENAPGSAVEVHLEIGNSGRSHSFRLIYLTDGEPLEIRERIEAWIASKKHITSPRKLSCQVKDTNKWVLPSDWELQRLSQKAGTYLSEDEFGPRSHTVALRKYNQGDALGAAEEFKQLLLDSGGMESRNNAAYCLAISGKADEALALMKDGNYPPSSLKNTLWLHNLAVLHYINNERDRSLEIMAMAWHSLNDQLYKDVEVYCMLTISPGSQPAIVSRDGLPLDAALVINRCLMGVISTADASQELERRYPDRFKEWSEWWQVPEPSRTESKHG